MKIPQYQLAFALLLVSALLSPAHSEIRALSSTELEATATIYRGQVVGIQWLVKPGSGCVSSVKEATISLQLNSSHGKSNGKPVLVKGFVNVLNGCPGSAGNWHLNDLKIGDKVIIYAEKTAANSLLKIRLPNGLSIIK